MRGLLLALACGLLLSGCATRSAGYRLYVPAPGSLIYYGRDFVMPIDPPLGAEEAARIEVLLQEGRVWEANVAVMPPMIGKFLSSATKTPAELEQYATKGNIDFIRLMVAARRQTTGSWTPSEQEIAKVERFLGRLWRKPDSRIRGIPAVPPGPLSQFYVIYAGITSGGKRYIVGRGDMGDASTLNQIQARQGSQHPAGGFRMLYDADADEVIEVVFQGGM